MMVIDGPSLCLCSILSARSGGGAEGGTGGGGSYQGIDLNDRLATVLGLLKRCEMVGMVVETHLLVSYLGMKNQIRTQACSGIL